MSNPEPERCFNYLQGKLMGLSGSSEADKPSGLTPGQIMEWRAGWADGVSVRAQHSGVDFNAIQAGETFAVPEGVKVQQIATMDDGEVSIQKVDVVPEKVGGHGTVSIGGKTFPVEDWRIQLEKIIDKDKERKAALYAGEPFQSGQKVIEARSKERPKRKIKLED